MAKQSEFKKYLPFEAWFAQQPKKIKEIELSFDQVEENLGAPSPLRRPNYKPGGKTFKKNSRPSHRMVKQWMDPDRV